MGLPGSRRARAVHRDLQAIGALTQAVLDGGDLESLLARVAAEARALVGAKFGVVVTIAGDPGVMTFRAVDGIATGPLRVGSTMPVRDTLTELAVTSGRNVVVSDATQIPPAGRAFAAATGAGALIAAPLVAIGPARGVLVIAKAADAPPFRPSEVQLITTFAAQGASAIELFELRAAEAAIAVRQERDRIVGDLNDSVLHALADLLLGIRALADETSDPLLAAEIDGSARQLDGAIGTIRQYASELAAAPDDGPASKPPASIAATSDAEAPTRSVGGSKGPDRARDGASTIEAIGDLARASVTGRPIEIVLQSLVDDVVARVDAETCLLGTVAATEDQIRVRARAGPALDGRAVGDVMPIGQTLAGAAIAHGGPLVLRSAEQATQVPAGVRQAIGPVVVVPLAVHGRAFGALVVARPPTGRAFAPAEVRLIEAYAVQAAIALEFERVRLELRSGPASTERVRLGRALHRHVIQQLFRVALALEAIEARVDAPSTRERVHAAVDGLDRAIRDLRRLVLDLAPRPLEADPRPDLAVLAADNARLQAVVERQLEEVRASRARIVAAGDAERKRVERNLHDGAQQRLVSLTLALRLARARLGDDVDPSARSSIDQAYDEAGAAMKELRELARGIHPQILTAAGLQPAVESLATRSPLDITVDVVGDRFASGVEGAAYFTISEGLTNAAKYASATRVDVTATWADDCLTVLIADDGVGGADVELGTGLRGLVDRLAAINGTLEILSPPGAGTRLRARIPTSAPVAVPVEA